MSEKNLPNNNQDIENIREEFATDTESKEGSNNGNQIGQWIKYLKMEIQLSFQYIHNLK